jgi:hypothetical protein
MEVGEAVFVEVSSSADDEAQDPKKKSWLELELVDQDGIPLAFEDYVVELPDGSLREGRLDDKGKSRLRGLDPGSCKVSFPRLAPDDWKKA